MSTTDPNLPPHPSSPTGFSAGQTLAGCYALSRRVGDADGPEIWFATDDVLGKDVTLHVLPPAVAKDSRALQELRPEVKRNRQLIHPQILRVFDLIEEPEWTAVSMNAFDGESLAARLAKQPGKRFAASEIEPWFYGLVQSIEDAHRVSFLHRDIAPQNIYFTGSGQLLVANFGISRIIQDSLARGGASDASRRALVSPQLREGGAATRADDVYSLGALLFTVLTGTPPADGANLSALDAPDLQVPPAWRQAIASALEAAPEKRPATASEFLKRLKEEVAAPAAVSVPAPTPPPAAAVEAKAPAPVPEPAEPTPAPELVAPPVAAEQPVEPPKPVAEEAPASKAEPTPKEEKPAASVSKPEESAAVVPPVEDEPDEILESHALESLRNMVRLESKSEPKPAPPEPLPTVEPKKAPPRTEPWKSPARTPGGELKPKMYPEESRFPIVAVGLAAVLLLAAIIWHFTTSGKKASEQEIAVATPAPATPNPEPEEVKPQSTPAATPVVASTERPKATPAAQTPAPSTPVPEEEKELVAKQSTIEKGKEAVKAAETSRATLAKQQQEADAALADSQKAVADRRKTYSPLKAAADEAAARRKKLEEDQKAAEAAAEEAQKVAAEKARMVEDGKKKLEEIQKESEEKQAAEAKANAELQTVQKTFEEKQKVATSAAKAVGEADAALQQQSAAVSKGERELEDAKAAVDLKKSLNEKIRNFTSFAKAGGTAAATTPPPKVPSAESSPTSILLMPSTPEPSRMTKLVTPTPAPSTPALPTPIATTPVPSTPAPATPTAKPVPATPAPATPVAATPVAATPVAATPVPATPVAATPAPATPAPAPAGARASGPITNSLGMKFAPVGDVDFCIWLTRVKDFEAFAKAVSLKSASWQNPGFRQGSDHPVVNVTWQEAVAFCKWLTDKEHKENVIPANAFYRLPTDLEWSKAVGLPDETGRTPEARDMGVPDVYPWGTQWPPPPGVGNYTGEETGSDVAIKGYEDGFAWTSPVGSFKPNRYGLYDMGGNVWQWCMDSWNAESKAKVLRGASWYNGALKLSLLSSCRVHAAPDSSTDNYGFRIVRATEGPSAMKSKFR